MNLVPVDIELSGIYFPPWLGSALLGLALALAITTLANWTGLSRFVWHPPLFFTALVVLCTVVVGVTLVPSFVG
ncbi:DUF1656 domain-containing protein [uncultured Thiodictyon sp.]|uniref:DUF1656 domain-containing protein n=1 Tax=uncultured Thiodictyon sp. TaxID=1846217 RepID=UPI0025D486C5|nr:DUF1656 domain-containing protein [uncultured Thiodictyon sp.]